MALYSLDEPPQPLVAPVLLAAFDGWIDAAKASTSACALVAGEGDALVTFDDDALYDYRARRPVLDIVDGTLTQLIWPDLSIKHTTHGGRDVLVFSGPEPDFRWQQLGREVSELATSLGVVEWVSLGSIPAAVPHTRPVPILATSSKHGLLQHGEQQGPDGLLRVPSAALSTVEMAVTAGGIPATGFYAQIPNYIGGPFGAATVALLDVSGQHLGVEFPLGGLPDEAAEQRRNLDAAVEAEPDSRAYVERLEQMVDEQRLPSGDELASEIERFLRTGDDPGDEQRPIVDR